MPPYIYKNGFHKEFLVAVRVAHCIGRLSPREASVGLTLAFTDAGLAITAWFGPCSKFLMAEWRDNVDVGIAELVDADLTIEMNEAVLSLLDLYEHGVLPALDPPGGELEDKYVQRLRERGERVIAREGVEDAEEQPEEEEEEEE